MKPIFKHFPHHIGAFAVRLLSMILLCGVASFAHAQGGPPLITDDPGTPGNKHWEINIAYTQSRYASGVVYETPHVDLNYGYGDNVQLKLEGPLTIYNAGGGVDLTGFGYSDWGVKWRFHEDGKSGPAMSIYPQIIFIGNQKFAQLGVTDPGTDFFMPFEVSKGFGKLTLDTEVGVMFREFAENQYWSGICGEYDVSKSLGLLAEVHLINTAGFTQDQFVWNLGFKKDLSENQSIIFSAGRSFANPTDDNPGFLLYAGVQIRT